MRTRGERQHLQADVALAVADIDEMPELSPHNVPPADQLPQGPLAEDRPELERVLIAGEHVLLGEANLDEMLVLRPGSP